MITITEQFSIPNDEIVITASRSSGPGGQNVNKVNTRVTLHFPVWSSKYLTNSQKVRIASCLKSRITKDGVLYLHAQGTRSQAANRILLIDRFVALIREALKRSKPRKKTRVPRIKVEQRLKQKNERSQLKKVRKQPSYIED
jgi:ribosome-associated protein